MPQNDPGSESKPVLIVSDGEEGNLVEKVIIGPKLPATDQPSAEQQSGVETDGTAAQVDRDSDAPADEKGS